MTTESQPAQTGAGEELLPCPFCASPIIMLETQKARYGEHPHNNCVHSCHVIYPGNFAAWNTRAEPTPPSADAMVHMVCNYVRASHHEDCQKCPRMVGTEYGQFEQLCYAISDEIVRKVRGGVADKMVDAALRVWAVVRPPCAERKRTMQERMRAALEAALAAAPKQAPEPGPRRWDAVGTRNQPEPPFPG